MAILSTEEIEQLDPETQMYLNAKQSGFNYRQRRHEDWTETYDLYRDKVQINRLTQRQSVHVPLMKMIVRSIMKDVDDMPVLYFENLDGDKDAEIFKNEYWKYIQRKNNMELQDIVDKRQVLMFGRSYDQWQIVDGEVKWTVQDPMDILIDRYVDPFNIDSARFLIHEHIFVPLAVLKQNEKYDQDVVSDLAHYYASQEGLIKSKQNEQSLQEKNQKLADMGLTDVDQPVLGETYVELTLFFHYAQYDKEAPEQLYLTVYAEDRYRLQKEKLETIIGETTEHYWRNHLPYESWADDLERQDWLSDGVGDTLRTANKILDVWYSQLVENRTLRSLDMFFYDATEDSFTPQVWQPQAFGMYGVPGDPNKIMKKVDIPDLSESLDEMRYIQELAEKATGATATQQGAQTERQVTLGEVQLALGEAKERVKGMSKFYTPAWERRGEKFVKLVEAAGDKLDIVKVFKKGRNTNTMYTRDIGPKDWASKAGYYCRVWSQDEKNEQDTQEIEKLTAVSANMPGNPKLTEIKNRKLLEFAGLSPDEINEVMQFEEAKQQMLQSMVGQGLEAPGMPAPVGPNGKPVTPPPSAPPPMLGNGMAKNGVMK